MSLTESSLTRTNAFVGLANYATLVSRPLVLGLGAEYLLFRAADRDAADRARAVMALLVDHFVKAQAWLQGVFFLPFVLPISVMTLIADWMLQPSSGVINHILGGQRPGWPTPLGAAGGGIGTVWWTVGFNMLLFLAGLRNIPADLYEAAALDGARGFTLFRAITWPALRPVATTALILQIIASLKVFGQTYILTSGGPFNTTRVTLHYMYETAFTQSDAGYAAAIAMAFVAIVILLSLLQAWRAFAGGRGKHEARLELGWTIAGAVRRGAGGAVGGAAAVGAVDGAAAGAGDRVRDFHWLPQHLDPGRLRQDPRRRQRGALAVQQLPGGAAGDRGDDGDQPDGGLRLFAAALPRPLHPVRRRHAGLPAALRGAAGAAVPHHEPARPDQQLCRHRAAAGGVAGGDLCVQAVLRRDPGRLPRSRRDGRRRPAARAVERLPADLGEHRVGDGDRDLHRGLEQLPLALHHRHLERHDDDPAGPDPDLRRLRRALRPADGGGAAGRLAGGAGLRGVPAPGDPGLPGRERLKG
jgi:multiple sugar transport system permease protein